MTTIKLGNIGCKFQAEKIETLLSGKTYMEFRVTTASCAGNWPVMVSTERPDTTEQELLEMVLFYIASNI